MLIHSEIYSKHLLNRPGSDTDFHNNIIQILYSNGTNFKDALTHWFC